MYIELPKFRKINPDMEDKVNHWLALIDDRKELVEMAEKKNETIRKARIDMDCLTGDAEIKRLAELREKWEMDYNSGIDYAKKEGKKEGKIEIAKKLKENKVDIEIIEVTTGLTKEEIEKL